MLKKEYRITKDKTFKKVMSSGKKYYSSNSIWFHLNRGGTLKKVGFIVSNKVSPRASRRNKIKRKLRGFVSENFDRIPDGLLVVMVKKDYQTSKDLIRDCQKQLKKIESSIK